MEKKLPIGIENFAEIRQEGFYYIDKTGLIRELLQDWGKVNLFTRPRRFGKSLNMSMLRYFFEIGSDKSLFDGLEIAKETELCDSYMGKFPVISISLKGVEAASYETARGMLRLIIREEVDRVCTRIEGWKWNDYQREILTALNDKNMSEDTLMNSLRMLSVLLYQLYGKKVIILIDEYDVPLDKAFQNGYYDQMAALIRNLFAQALKTNECLQFAVLTGCLRIAKESIFTGLNNLRVFSITSNSLDEYFGFTDQEVRKLLGDYGQERHYAEAKAWYDGYRFGAADVYCPWDVINYCSELRADSKAEPQAYWANTSGNAIVKRLLQKATGQTKREMEQLVAGETIEKKVVQELTYNELENSIENMWSVLFVTGYLTSREKKGDGIYALGIPNREVRQIFVEQIQEWFAKTVRSDGTGIQEFCNAVKEGNAELVEEKFREYLRKTISIRDTFQPKARKESFYHGVLLGLLSNEADWYIRSNEESGEGYSDILVEMEEDEKGAVIEVKYSDDGEMERDAKKALLQIKEKDYAERLRGDGMKKILGYGIACCKKRCRVACEEL